ncbi:MAG TPA: hypothetical protein PL072_08805 [Phycisphaerales bacterium]|nr:hypothetical protein [Phycisphaerales bacterium]
MFLSSSRACGTNVPQALLFSGAIVLLAVAMIIAILAARSPKPVFLVIPMTPAMVAWIGGTSSRLGDLHARARRNLREGGYDLRTLADESARPECASAYSPLSLRQHWEEAYRRMLDKPGR